MKIIDLLIKKANNGLMPNLIKITWIDYEMEYYLDDIFWYRSIKDDKRLEILPNILNFELEVITNEYKQLVQKDEIIEEDKEIEELYIEKDINSNNYYLIHDDIVKCQMTIEEEYSLLKHLYYNSTNLTIDELKELNKLIQMLNKRI